LTSEAKGVPETEPAPNAFMKSRGIKKTIASNPKKGFLRTANKAIKPSKNPTARNVLK